MIRSMNRPTSEHAQGRLHDVVACAGRVVLGKERPVRLALACLVARGHLLIEDLPGVGKTLLAQVLARTLGLQFHRVQFTSDLLPADILGVSVYDRDAAAFRFHPGPIFAHVVLADEINRATPKTQSALLEAMEEGQVTVDGETRALPEPFFVVATQNPSHQVGTFPLPESQLDRFLMRLRLGYPDPEAERALLQGKDRRELLREMAPCVRPGELAQAQEAVPRVHASEALLDYLQALLGFTRSSGEFGAGLSPRAGLALLRSAQAWALLEGREYVLPEDVQAVLPAVASHRLAGAEALGPGAEEEKLRRLVESVPVP
jgi:MoxR-like ATPase